MTEVEKSSEYMTIDRKTRASAVKAGKPKRSTRTPEKDETVQMSMSMPQFSDGKQKSIREVLHPGQSFDKRRNT